MSLIVGIDEAGYGPMLGPLVVSSAAFDVPDGDGPADLWELLGSSVSRTRRGAGERLLVADSKIVYGGGRGLADLERAVLAFLAAAGKGPATFRSLLDGLCSRPDVLCNDAWWRDLALPASAETVPSADRILDAGKGGARFLGFATQVVHPDAFNELLDRHGNKSVLLFQQSMTLVERALDRLQGDVEFIIDKHGGRHYYADLLCNNFFGASVSCLVETPKSSSYEVRLRGRSIRLTFAEKADAFHLPAALASMACKYVRELFMTGFNAYWCGRVKGLEPTAGYCNDCYRFIAAIRPLIPPGEEHRIVRRL